MKVKTNQPKLYEQIETESNQQIAKQKMEHQEKTRDRNSYRKVEVFEPSEKIDPSWIGVGCVIKVERSGTRGNQPYQSISYYICSLSPQSRRLVDDIRGHWVSGKSFKSLNLVFFQTLPIKTTLTEIENI